MDNIIIIIRVFIILLLLSVSETSWGNIIEICTMIKGCWEA